MRAFVGNDINGNDDIGLILKHKVNYCYQCHQLKTQEDIKNFEQTIDGKYQSQTEFYTIYWQYFHR